MADVTNALPSGYALHEYRVESVLGAGGFGLTYLATDSNLNLTVALKEYLPNEYASRGEDSTVQPKSATAAETFQWGLQRFLDEARTLASFHHPSIVRVMRFFEANRTGYMVMEFVQGFPLSDWITARRPLPQLLLLPIVASLLDGLEVIHKAGYLHRDIKPANIFIRDEGGPVLLDFGSARQLISGRQELTAVVSPGFAPLEQYHAHGKQGPWSDIYALGGVLYWMVTGSKPIEATARVREDSLVPAAKAAIQGVYGADLLAAIDWALMPNEEERPKSIAEFRRALLGSAPRPAASERVSSPAAADAPTVAVKRDDSGRTSGLTGILLDHGQVKRIEADLAEHIGPIAAVVVRSAARNAASILDLAEAVSGEIVDDRARDAFVTKYATGETSRPAPSQPASGEQLTVSQKFSAETLRNAEIALAQYIGAIARVVVKRAAAVARDEAELYLLIADEIKNPAERKSFVRKAISVSKPG